MNEVRTKLSPPWVTYIHKLTAMFDGDPHIALNVDYDEPSVAISVAAQDGEKAAAIAALLPVEKQFGNVTLYIDVVCDNMPDIAFISEKELYDTAFRGNPCFAYTVVPASEYWTVPFTYVVFKNCVVQFFNDNLDDPHGVVSTLYQEIASDLFENNQPFLGMVTYCTDIEQGRVGMPLGEWP